MGNIIWRFMKASPDTAGWAISTFVWVVTIQLAVVTTMGFFHYDSIAEDSQVYDYVWFVYREMPSTLPMILVYAGAITGIILPVGIFIRIGFTIRELPRAVRHRPLRFVWKAVLLLLCLAVFFAGWLFGQSILVFLVVPILGAFLGHEFVRIWIAWARAMVKSATEEEREHAPDAEESSGGKHGH